MPAIFIARSGSDDNAPLSQLVHIRDIQAVTTSPSRVADVVSFIVASDVITSLRASDPTPSAVSPSTAAAHTLSSQSPARLASVHYTSSSSHSSSNTSPNNKGLETGLIIVAVAFIVLGAAYRIYRYIQKRRNRQQLRPYSGPTPAWNGGVRPASQLASEDPASHSLSDIEADFQTVSTELLVGRADDAPPPRYSIEDHPSAEQQQQDNARGPKEGAGTRP